MHEIVSAVGPSGAKVSRLDFELRKGRESQNTSFVVGAKALTTISLLTQSRTPDGWSMFDMSYTIKQF
ncbi:hypothetical protein LNA01_19270 [Companilactobacillus nantensis]|nr:hypothetical protein LNA01_19270 [Companilactobacillus nantensis]